MADRRAVSTAGPSQPEQRALGNQATQYLIQAKLRVGAPDDRFEREADRVAEQVMRMPLPDAAGPTEAPARAANIKPRVQRRSVEEDEDLTLQAKAADSPAGPQGPGTERLVTSLQKGGQPLPAAQRAFFEPRFGVDFGSVRIHRGSRAAQAAHGIGARAYTLGRNVVFGRGEYRPGTEPGRRLIAHELAHVIQQGHAPRGPAAAPPQTAPRGRTAGTAVQRQAEVQDMRAATGSLLLHPAAPSNGVKVDILAHRQGGLMNDSQLRPRVSAIIGPSATIRGIAEAIRPHFVAATPNPSPTVNSTAPTVEEIAKALLVYSQYYLPVPSGERGAAATPLENFRVGLRLTLPIEIDIQTQEWVVSPPLIRLWAESYESGWQPFLDQPAAGYTPRTTTELDTEVTDFLQANTTALAQGIALGARMLTNPVAAVQFALKVFDRLEAASAESAFNAALELMNFSVNHQIGLLARLGAGAAILWRLRTLLSLPPAGLSEDREAERARAMRMLPGEFVLGETAQGRPLRVLQFPGRTTRRALVIAGVHGSEQSGIEAVELLRQSLESAAQPPYFTVILVPIVFPDNYERARREGSTPTNRNFPAPGESLSRARERGQARRRPRGPIDERGHGILPENIMLMNLIERFRPERIASVHSTRTAASAGVFSDPETGPASDLALEMAQQIAGVNPDWVRGNSGDNPVWSGGTPGGTSLGGWGPGAVNEGRETDRPGAIVITVEIRRGHRSDDPDTADPEERLLEIEAHRDALRDIFLGPPGGSGNP